MRHLSGKCDMTLFALLSSSSRRARRSVICDVIYRVILLLKDQILSTFIWEFRHFVMTILPEAESGAMKGRGIQRILLTFFPYSTHGLGLPLVILSLIFTKVKQTKVCWQRPMSPSSFIHFTRSGSRVLVSGCL